MKILLILFCFFSSLLYFQKQYTDVIPWNEKKELEFNDYLGTVPDSTIYGAVTNYTIRFRVSFSNDTLYVIISNIFNKKKSWIKYNDIYLIKHENLHFDLAELYTRKIRYAITKYNRIQIGNEKQIAYSLDSIYSLFYDTLEIVQDQYDLETNLSIDSLKQEEWNTKVARELIHYTKYKDTLLIKPLKFEE